MNDQEFETFIIDTLPHYIKNLNIDLAAVYVETDKSIETEITFVCDRFLNDEEIAQLPQQIEEFYDDNVQVEYSLKKKYILA